MVNSLSQMNKQQQRITRSNSLNSNLLNGTSPSSRRKYTELSPDHTDPVGKRQDNKTSPDKKQTTMAAHDLQTINNTIAEMNKNMISEFQKLNSRFDDLESRLSNANQEIEQIKEKQTVQDSQIASLHSQLNKQIQLGLENQLSIHNLPSKLDAKMLIESLNKWSHNLFNETMIKKINLPLNKSKTSKSAYIHFWDDKDKIKLLKFIKAQQKDNNKKYKPILNEDIFQLGEADTNRGVSLSFRSPMSEINREIFNYLRKESRLKYKEAAVWISQGLVMIKIRRDDKPIAIHSIQQARQLLNNAS
jgi:tetrahydromethanopterin S-methyltransferase subunit G